MKNLIPSFALFFAGFLLFSGTAYSQSTRNYSGFYAGPELGLGTFKADASTVDLSSLAGATGSFGNLRFWNLQYGGVVGFRQQFDSNLVVGIEGRYGHLSGSDVNTFQYNAPAVTTGTYRVDSGRYYGGDLVLGYIFDAQKKALLYGSVGYTNAKVGSYVSAPAGLLDANGNPTIGLKGEEEGVRIAVGMEYRLTEMFSGRFNVSYADLDAFQTTKFTWGFLANF